MNLNITSLRIGCSIIPCIQSVSIALQFKFLSILWNAFEFIMLLDFSGTSFSAFELICISSLIFSVFLWFLYDFSLSNNYIFFVFMSRIIIREILKFYVTSISGSMSSIFYCFEIMKSLKVASLFSLSVLIQGGE